MSAVLLLVPAGVAVLAALGERRRLVAARRRLDDARATVDAQLDRRRRLELEAPVSAAAALRRQEELITTANRIAAATQHHNDTAVLFNSAVQGFPRVLLRIAPVDYVSG